MIDNKMLHFGWTVHCKEIGIVYVLKLCYTFIWR